MVTFYLLIHLDLICARFYLRAHEKGKNDVKILVVIENKRMAR
ncbi:MAG: hypothetical protein ACI8YI_002711 [Paracoccaceae bacterium]|jgi:hypothetical protein